MMPPRSSPTSCLLDIHRIPRKHGGSSKAPQENRYGREVTLYTHEEEGYQVVLNPLTAEVLALRPLQLSREATSSPPRLRHS